MGMDRFKKYFGERSSKRNTFILYYFMASLQRDDSLVHILCITGCVQYDLKKPKEVKLNIQRMKAPRKKREEKSLHMNNGEDYQMATV